MRKLSRQPIDARLATRAQGPPGANWVAFADVPRPRNTHSVARGFDDEWELSSERIDELAARDSEQSWRDVSDNAIEEFGEYFNFSDAEGGVYLPAR